MTQVKSVKNTGNSISITVEIDDGLDFVIKLPLQEAKILYNELRTELDNEKFYREESISG